MDGIMPSIDGTLRSLFRVSAAAVWSITAVTQAGMFPVEYNIPHKCLARPVTKCSFLAGVIGRPFSH